MNGARSSAENFRISSGKALFFGYRAFRRKTEPFGQGEWRRLKKCQHTQKMF